MKFMITSEKFRKEYLEIIEPSLEKIKNIKDLHKLLIELDGCPLCFSAHDTDPDTIFVSHPYDY